MKNIKNVVLLMISIVFFSYTATAQEETVEDISTITGTFIGMEGGTYGFTFKDEDGEESTMNFNKISPDAKKMIDLSDTKMIGQLFTITFSNENEEEEEEDGDITYTSVKTILKIEKAKK